MNMMDFVGQTFGQYRIEAVINAGGMGQVFRGVDIRLGRPAAIKLMHANLAANPQFRYRFLQEARSAAALMHSNIVTIYGFDEQNGQCYLAMELMTGGSLRTLLNQRRSGRLWPLALGLDLIRQAAEGLAAAHAKMVIHRDIKPDNLLLNRVNEPGSGRESYQLKISDFGLARLAQGSGMTTVGMPMGTLAYMSPEQCMSKAMDGRSDLYSLGIVLYEVATGSQPFQIGNFGEALDKHVNAAPPPPRQICAELPPVLEAIILRCLAKQPEDRYQTGTELADALQHAMAGDEMQTIGSMLFTIPDQFPMVQQPTILKAPSTQPAIAPAIPSLLGYATAPRVHVFDQNGTQLQAPIELTQRGLVIGRQNADIVLLGNDVSQRHVQIMWDGRQVMVRDLGSRNGTILDGTRLIPQVSQLWKSKQLLGVGPYWLRLEGIDAASIQISQSMLDPTFVSETMPGQGPVPLTAGFTQQYAQRTPVSSSIPGGNGSQRIGVLVEPRPLTITPGQPASIKVTLANMGNIVDWFTVTVEGVAPDWVRGSGMEVQLNPSTQDTVELRINVARAPNNLAQDYPVLIRARSRENPNEFGLARGYWTVLPFRDDLMRLEPRRVRGQGQASFTVVLQNGGNVSARYELSGDDDEQKMDYHFNQSVVDLGTGREARIPLLVVANRRWLGQEQRRPFQIHVRTASPVGSMVRPLSSTGEFVNTALLPTWIVLAALIAFLLGGVALGFTSGVLHNPLIQSTPTNVVVVPTARPTPTAIPTPITPTLTSVTPTPIISPTPIPSTGGGSVISWTKQNVGISHSLRGITLSITSSGIQYVAVGLGGSIYTSPDGINWTQVTSIPANTSDLNAVIWAKSQYIAVGNAGTILISPDGNNWTAQNPVTTNNLMGIIWANNRYVVVGSAGTIFTSTDGSTWQQGIVPPNTTDLGSVAASNQLFVAVGGPTNGAIGSGTILTSSDGVNWTPQVSHTTNYLRSITWSGTQFVAVGNSGTILISPDGSNWTNKPIAGVDRNFGVIYWSGSQYVLGGINGVIFTSTDAITWTPQNSPTTNYISAVINAESKYIAVGQYGTILTGQ